MPLLSNIQALGQQLVKLFGNISQSDALLALVIAVGLIVIGLFMKSLATVPLAETASLQEINRAIVGTYQQGLDFCLLSIGLYLTAYYSTPLFGQYHDHKDIFPLLLFISFTLLIFCTGIKKILGRKFLFTRLWWIEVVTADFIGLFSLGFCFLTLLGVER